MRYDIDRFPNYRSLVARRAGTCSSTICGQPFPVNSRIGWNGRNKKTLCPACWERWEAENLAADADERMYSSQY
jgi:hypothetical protein